MIRYEIEVQHNLTIRSRSITARPTAAIALMGVKMVVIIVLAMSVLWEDLVCKMVAIPNDCFMLRGALNVRFTTLLFHIGPYFRSYWRYPSSKKL